MNKMEVPGWFCSRLPGWCFQTLGEKLAVNNNGIGLGKKNSNFQLPNQYKKQLMPTSNSTEKDLMDIDQLTARFYDLFTNTHGRIPTINSLKDFFIPEGTIINNTAEHPAIYDLDSFILPRQELLSDGSLIDFSENETAHTTTIQNNIAHRISQYAKSGILNNSAFSGKGFKMMQFIKVKEKWFFSSVVWTDDPI